MCDLSTPEKKYSNVWFLHSVSNFTTVKCILSGKREWRNMPSALLHNLKQPPKRNVKICTRQLQLLYMFLFSFADFQQGAVKRFRASGNHSNKEFLVQPDGCITSGREHISGYSGKCWFFQKIHASLQFWFSGTSPLGICESQFWCKPELKQLQVAHTRAGCHTCSVIPWAC